MNVISIGSIRAIKHSYNELRATADSTAQHNKKAWEIGIGGSMINWNRVEVTGFKSTQDNYFYNLKTNHLMGGVNLYVARELNPWFYLDLQGDLGMAKNKFRDATNDKNSFLPLSLGAGINAWLNNSLGLGLQGEYLMPLQKDLPRFVQVSARVMWRIGGKSKRTAPIIQYVEVEKPVERIVEKIVEKRVEVPSTDGRFLITGYTDAKGSDSYNLDLSRRRAKAVYNELLKRDVPRNMLKWRGVGKRASLISASERNLVREGDRKVLLEKVTNRQYWDALGE